MTRRSPYLPRSRKHSRIRRQLTDTPDSLLNTAQFPQSRLSGNLVHRGNGADGLHFLGGVIGAHPICTIYMVLLWNKFTIPLHPSAR